MSAGAVRQGRVFVEIGADSKAFVSAMAQVNRQISDLGSVALEVGAKLTAIGAAITAPLAAAATQFGDLGGLLRDIQDYAGVAAGDIDGLKKAAASLGLVLDRQTAMASLQLAASTNKMRLSMLAAAATVGSIVAPEFTGFAEAVARVTKDATVFLRENRKIITVALAVGSALTGIGVVLTSVGGALKAFTANTSFLLGPMLNLIRLTAVLTVNMARLAVASMAAHPVLTILGVALAGAAVVAVRSAGGFSGAKDMIVDAFTAIAAAAQRSMPNMYEVVSTTTTGAYNAIANGDLAGAVRILWDGAIAAWTVGSAAIMGVLDPWIETVQNAWGSMVTFLANAWDRGFANLATSDWGGYLIGAFDNVINALMAAWDYMLGSLQKGWAWLTSKFQAGVDLAGEFRRIDDENRARAEERGRMRPGIEGRTNLTDQEKAAILADAERRADARVAANEQAQRDRRDRTEQRARDRPGEIRAAIADLKARTQEVAANVPDRAPIVPQRLTSQREMRGTFSALAARDLTFGTKGVDEQQLDVLKQIAFNTKDGGGGKVKP